VAAAGAGAGAAGAPSVAHARLAASTEQSPSAVSAGVVRAPESSSCRAGAWCSRQHSDCTSRASESGRVADQAAHCGWVGH
jgi:hypothetical protein